MSRMRSRGVISAKPFFGKHGDKSGRKRKSKGEEPEPIDPASRHRCRELRKRERRQSRLCIALLETSLRLGYGQKYSNGNLSRIWLKQVLGLNQKGCEDRGEQRSLKSNIVHKYNLTRKITSTYEEQHHV